MTSIEHEFFPGHDESLAEKLAWTLVQMGTDLDALVVTGDLASTGHRADLSCAVRYFTTPRASEGWLTTRRSPTLAALPAVTVMPGNHDRYQVPYTRPGGIEFDRVFRRLWLPVGPTWPKCRVAIGPLLQKANHQVLFVAIDLCLRRSKDALPLLTLGQGMAYQDVLDVAVAETTLRAAAPSVLPIWLVHFPPNASFGLRLLEEQQLFRALSDARVPIVFFGHTHTAAVRIIGERLGMFTACTATQLDPGDQEIRSYSVYTVEFEQSEKHIRIAGREFVMAGDEPGLRQLGDLAAYYLRRS